MLVALIASDAPDAPKSLVIGLEADNMASLANDMPIEIEDAFAGNPLVPDLHNVTIYVLGPEETERFIASHAAEQANGSG